MATTYVLLQFGTDPFDVKFEDLEGRAAFTTTQVEQNPNLVVQVSREPEWSLQHPDIMGPMKSYLYFGPSKSPGYLIYGNGPTNAMTNSLKRKKESSSSRYFTVANGREFKWKISPGKMECVDGRSTIAVWEVSESAEDVFDARLTIKHAGLAIVTELVTTLNLNRIAQVLSWH